MNDGFSKQDRLLPEIFKNFATLACQRTINVNQTIEREKQLLDAQKKANSKVEEELSKKIMVEKECKQQQKFRQELIQLMGVPLDVEDEYTRTVLFNCQRESNTCFYRIAPELKD